MTTTPKTKTTAKPTAVKAAPKAVEADVFAFPAVDVAPFRDLAESNAQRSKEAYEQLKLTAEDAATVLEEAITKSRDGVLEFNSKAIEAVQENADATFTHAKDVFAVKSFSEVIELQTSFMKKQAETYQDQVKNFQELTIKFTEEASAPYRRAFQKSAEAFKVA